MGGNHGSHTHHSTRLVANNIARLCVLMCFIFLVNNLTLDGNNDTSDGLSNDNIIAIASVLVAFLSLIATIGE